MLFTYGKFPGNDVIGGDSCVGGPIVFAESAAHLVSISSAVARVLRALSAADAGDVLSQNALQITLTLFSYARSLHHRKSPDHLERRFVFIFMCCPQGSGRTRLWSTKISSQTLASLRASIT
jgi:hypothetical protein